MVIEKQVSLCCDDLEYCNTRWLESSAFIDQNIQKSTIWVCRLKQNVSLNDKMCFSPWIKKVNSLVFKLCFMFFIYAIKGTWQDCIHERYLTLETLFSRKVRKYNPNPNPLCVYFVCIPTKRYIHVVIDRLLRDTCL